jgi:hypothetical protein
MIEEVAEATGNTDTPAGKNWTIIGLKVGIAFVVIAIAVYLIIVLFSSTKISESQLEQGYSGAIGEGKKISFELINESHSIKVNSVSDNSVEITVSSNPITVSLSIGEEKKFDINGDGNYELSVILNSIDNGNPQFTIRKISEPVSQVPSVQGVIDQNITGILNESTGDNLSDNNQSNNSMCIENWSCSTWSDCAEGLQTRTCNDLDNCGTVHREPSISKLCGADAINCTAQYLPSDGLQCNSNGTVVQEVWQYNNCTSEWRNVNYCSGNLKCVVSNSAASCALKSCSELGGLACNVTQTCQNNNSTQSGDTSACCLSSCINNATTCTESQMKAISDNELATDSIWNDFTNITYNKMVEYSQWQLYYCATRISTGDKDQLMFNFYKNGSFACSEAGSLYVLDSLNGNICT